jgi:glycine cleavage system H protein
MTPEDLKYTKEHEWIRIVGDTGTVGITSFAQKELGDVVYVELPKVGDQFDLNEAFGTLESVKTVSELFMPLSAEVTQINDALDGKPELVNDDSYGDGWLIQIRMREPSETENLLSAEAYDDYADDTEE